MESMREKVVAEFQERHGTAPSLLVRAPGRVNLIGEHTDYNDGFVLPMAIDREMWMACHPRADREVVIYALDMDEEALFHLDDFSRSDDNWIEYVKGIAFVLQERGSHLQGWEGVIGGDVPIGAGLSSSAALELATARVFAAISGIEWNAKEMAKLGQRAENEWVGVNCGIMDQMISAAGEPGHALLIDCRNLNTSAVPLPRGTNVVILDTATRRGLVDSAYNERRQQCEEAAAFFGVPALRDVTSEMFEEHAAGLDELAMRRARHVISENARTVEAAAAMKSGDAVRLGELMDASHASMRDDFEISSNELNTMVTIARAQPGCFGARMTGGGFAGCAVALVASDFAAPFSTAVAEEYARATGMSPHIYVCEATGGAEVIS
ncbi:MAG: galactokinase [Candidatus Promineifilaceae bacterium]